METAPTSFPRLRGVALCLLAALLAPASSGRAEQAVALDSGVSLAWDSGNLDSKTLAGSAGDVRISIGDFVVATAKQMTLETQGTHGDPGFTVTDLEVKGVVTMRGKARIARVSGKDIPFSLLWALAHEADRMTDPTTFDVYQLIGRARLGTLTFHGIEAQDGAVQVSIAKAGVGSVANGTIGFLDIEKGTVINAAQELEIQVESARLTDLSIDPRVFAGFSLRDFSFQDADLTVSLESADSRTTPAELEDGTTYPARSAGSVTDLKITPGKRPSAPATAFFADLGEGGLLVNGVGLSTITPDGSNLAIVTSLKLSSQKGDAFDLASRWLLPISSWKIFDATVARDPIDTDPEAVMHLVTAVSLVEADLTLTGARLADAALASTARFNELTPGDMRQILISDASELLSMLPDGGASLRKPVIGFIEQHGTLDISIRPPYPVPLSTIFLNEEHSSTVWNQLNITARHEAP